MKLKDAISKSAPGRWIADQDSLTIVDSETNVVERPCWCNLENSFYMRNAGLQRGNPNKLSGDKLDEELDKLRDKDFLNSLILAHCRNYLPLVITAILEEQEALRVYKSSGKPSDYELYRTACVKLDAIVAEAQEIQE